MFHGELIWEAITYLRSYWQQEPDTSARHTYRTQRHHQPRKSQQAPQSPAVPRHPNSSSSRPPPPPPPPGQTPPPGQPPSTRDAPAPNNILHSKHIRRAQNRESCVQMKQVCMYMADYCLVQPGHLHILRALYHGGLYQHDLPEPSRTRARVTGVSRIWPR